MTVKTILGSLVGRQRHLAHLHRNWQHDHRPVAPAIDPKRTQQQAFEQYQVLLHNNVEPAAL